MWTRAELKANARMNLKDYYWMALLVTFLTGCISGGISSNSSVNFDVDDLGYMSPEVLEIILPGIIMSVLTVSLLSFIVATFFGNIIVVGSKRFFICARLKDVSISHMFDGFRGGHYVNIMLTMLIMNVKIFLWSLLFVIPGIIKSFEYMMVPYILAEDPTVDRDEAFRRSKIMMEGEKWDTFVLGLSFIGWYLLGMLACCVGMIFVAPYHEATMTELYDRLRTKILPKQTPDIFPTDFHFDF